MSRQLNNKNSKNNNNTYARKPFCKVCADAGKTDTAHFPRKTPDPNSEVVCPTLLALECRYCFKNGHTVKYCVVLKQRKDYEEQTRREHEKHQRQVERQEEQDRLARLPPVAKKSTGKFDAFADEQEEEDRETARIAEDKIRFDQAVQQAVAQREAEFPSILSKKAHTIVTGGNNWAAMATNAALLAVPKPKIQTILPKVEIKGHWADDSDDEEELELDDHEEEVITTTTTAFAFPSSAPCYARSGWDDDDW